MAITTTRLLAVKGDTNEWDFAYSGTPDSAVFSVTSPAHPYSPIFEKTLNDGVSEIESGLRVRLDPSDLESLTETMTILSYFLRVEEGVDTTTLFAGAIYIYPH